MFLILTVLTTWYYLIFGWRAFDHPFKWDDLGAWGHVVTSPISLTLFLFWVIGTVVGLFVMMVRSQSQYFFYNSGRRLRSTHGNLLKFVDSLVLLASIALAVYGGVAGHLAPLILGTMLTIGLLLHLAEQLFRERFL